VDSASGISYTSFYDLFTVGAGYLDLGAAIAGIGNVTTSGNSLSPVANYSSTSGTVTIVFDPASVFSNKSVWGAQSVWGARSIWGASVLTSANQALWGTQSVWGASGANSTQSIWGAEAVWGAQSVWGADSESYSQDLPISITGEK
jgi:serine protease AprX